MFLPSFVIRLGVAAAALGAGALAVTGSPAAGVGSFVLALMTGFGRRQMAVWAHGGQRSRLVSGLTGMGDVVPVSAVPAGTRERWAHARRWLPAQLTEEPLENGNVLEISHLYLHEPGHELERITAEYRLVRGRFLRWLAETRAVERDGGRAGVTAGEIAGRVQALDGELTAIERYLVDLQERASDGRTLGERAWQICEEVEAQLIAARSGLEAVGGVAALPEAATRLADAEVRLGEAWAAMQPGAERPVTAMRLATEAHEQVTAAQAVVGRAADLPRTLDERLAAFAEARGRVAREISDANVAFAAVTGQYAPSTWVELRGLGAAGERALQRAGELARGAAARRGAGGGLDALEQAWTELETAFAALDEAAAHAGTILDHVRRLEGAAAGARGAIAGAEAVIDRALAGVQMLPAADDVRHRRDNLLARAGELVTQARTELAKPQPDWLSVQQWAERAKDLADQAGAAPPVGGTAPELQALVEMERSRAKSARDQVQALVLALPPGEVGAAAYQVVNQAEKAYQRAVELEQTMTEQSGGGLHPVAVQGLLDTYRDAEQQALMAAAQVRSEMERMVVMQRSPAPAGLFGGAAWFGAGLLDDIDF